MNREEAELLKTAEGYPILESGLLTKFKWDIIKKYGTPDGFDRLVKTSVCKSCNGEGIIYDENEEPCDCRTCKGTGRVNVIEHYYRYHIQGILFRKFCKREVNDEEVYNIILEIFPNQKESTKNEAYTALLKLAGKYDRRIFEQLLQGFWGDMIYQLNKTEIDSFIKNKQEVVCE